MKKLGGDSEERKKDDPKARETAGKTGANGWLKDNGGDRRTKEVRQLNEEVDFISGL